jgi:hypothetical protein
MRHNSTLAEALLRDLAGRMESREHVPMDMYMTAVLAVLAYAGPPCVPISDYSEDHRGDFARGKSGRARFWCETWVTSPWRCLRIDVPSVPMGRPFALRPTDAGALPVLHLDRASTRFQEQIRMAIAALGLRSPIGRCVVHVTSSTSSTFIAWREFDSEFDGQAVVDLPGDVDNYAKNALDGLQKAGVLINDKDVETLRSSKALPAEFGDLPTLEDRLLAALRARVSNDSPVADLEAAREMVGVTRAQMATWFPAFPLRREARPNRQRPSTRSPTVPGETMARVKACYDAAVEAKTTGNIVAHIADTLGVHRTTVTRHIRKLGIPLPGRPKTQRVERPQKTDKPAPDPDVIVQAIHHAADGDLSRRGLIAQVARDLRIDRRTVAKHVKALLSQAKKA